MLFNELTILATLGVAVLLELNARTYVRAAYLGRGVSYNRFCHRYGGVLHLCVDAGRQRPGLVVVVGPRLPGRTPQR